MGYKKKDSLTAKAMSIYTEVFGVQTTDKVKTVSSFAEYLKNMGS